MYVCENVMYARLPAPPLPAVLPTLSLSPDTSGEGIDAS